MEQAQEIARLEAERDKAIAERNAAMEETYAIMSYLEATGRR